MWHVHLINAQEIEVIFPDEEISLNDLSLLRLQYLPGNQLLIDFLQKELPKNIPKRWLKKSAAGVELRFKIGVSSLNFELKKECTRMPLMRVLIEKGKFSILEREGMAMFLVATCFYMQLSVFPLDSVPTL